MAETEQRYLSVVTRGCYLGVPWHNEVAVYCSDRLAFSHRWTELYLTGSTRQVHLPVIECIVSVAEIELARIREVNLNGMQGIFD